MKKRILILYTSVGHGHKKIAENIGFYLSETFQVDFVDILRFEKGKLVDTGSKFYFWMLKHWPGLWNFFYTNQVFISLTLPFRPAIARYKSEKLLALINEKHYDAVLCTHVNASAIVSYLKEKGLFKGKFIAAFSDFHLHRFWLFKNADLFLANIPEQKQQMIKLGFDPKRIAVCGITLKPKKALTGIDLRKKYGIEAGQKIVLVLGGSRGMGIESKLISSCIQLNAKIFIVCGTNKQAYDQLSKFYSEQQNIAIFGYIDFMDELYDIADIVITKPGGLTVAECLQHNLPIAVANYLPGQEGLNIEYLRKNHLIMPAVDDLVAQVEYELCTGEFASSLQKNPLVSKLVGDGKLIQKELTDLI